MTKTHTFTTLMRRLRQAGFDTDFLRTAILPDWWAEECANDSAVLSDVEIRVARFLGRSISEIQNPAVDITAPTFLHAQLRRVSGTDREKIRPAIHSAMRVAEAVVRSLRQPAAIDVPPADARAWRKMLRKGNEPIALNALLTDLWQRGIPVVPLDVLPSPSFQGMACVVEGRPVILLGHKHDAPGRIGFFVAHEVGHVAAGECRPDMPVLDGNEDLADDTQSEQRADLYAWQAMAGDVQLPDLQEGSPENLARQAARSAREAGLDAGVVLFGWARRTGNYQPAQMAVAKLYLAKGAKRILREHFDHYVDAEAASESDRALLRCVDGVTECDAVAG